MHTIELIRLKPALQVELQWIKWTNWDELSCSCFFLTKHVTRDQGMPDLKEMRSLWTSCCNICSVVIFSLWLHSEAASREKGKCGPMFNLKWERPAWKALLMPGWWKITPVAMEPICFPGIITWRLSEGGQLSRQKNWTFPTNLMLTKHTKSSCIGSALRRD